MQGKLNSGRMAVKTKTTSPSCKIYNILLKLHMSPTRIQIGEQIVKTYSKN